jgi:glycosyltransferase involved in cell wall biosynthesis
MPRVSILIPCYNCERWVAEAIQSALDQTHDDKEVIVVDDGSTDKSLEVIKSFGARIHWQSGPNLGGNVARNALLKLSHGEWLQYLDADDYLLPCKISTQIGEADLGTADVLWSPSIYEFCEPDGVTHTETQQLEAEDPWVALIRWRLPQTGAALWRKQSLVEAGCWREEQRVCQEHELYLRCLKHGAVFQFCPSGNSVYRQWSTDTVCRRDPLRTNLTRMSIIDEAERFLLQTNALTTRIRDELMAARIQCARSCYLQHPEFSMDLVEKAVNKANHRRLPDEPWFPRMYRWIFFLAGFRASESVAALARMKRRDT